MTLEDALLADLDVAARCHAVGCGVVTPLNPKFFVQRYGTRMSFERLADRLVCAGCGSRSVSIELHRPAPISVPQRASARSPLTSDDARA
jgi:hypothetical protein